MKQKDKIILELIKKYNKNKLLQLIDVGSRDQFFKNQLPKNIRYHSLDVNTKFNPDIVCDISKNIPLKNEVYDILVCSEVLEHIIYPRKVIQELKRIVKKDGIIILTLPNEYNLNLRLQFLFGIQKGCEVPFKNKLWMNHIHRPKVVDAINFYKDYFNLKEIKYSWDSAKGISKTLDPIIQNIFLPISKNLFTTSIIMIGTKK